MQLDEEKMKAMFKNLYQLQQACGGVVATWQKNNTLWGLKSLSHIGGHGNWENVATDTTNFEREPNSIQQARQSIQILKTNYAKVLEGLDYVEGVLKELDHE